MPPQPAPDATRAAPSARSKRFVSRTSRFAGPVRFVRSVSTPLAVYVSSRAVTVAAMAPAMLVPPRRTAHQIFSVWDGAWYLEVARSGYPHVVPEVGGSVVKSTLGFFPLFPLILRAGHSVGLPYIVAGLLAAMALGAIAMVVIWLLVKSLSGADAANRTVALLCFFPGSIVCSLVYSEALMLALAAGCLLALLRQRWLIAGTLAALATATRPTAGVLIACCLWEALRAIRSDRRAWRSLIAPAVAPLGLISFFLFLRVRTGSTLAYMHTQRQGWGERISLATPAHQIADVSRTRFGDLNVLVVAIGIVTVFVLGLMLVRSGLPSVLSLYSLGLVAAAMLSSGVGPRPRFIFVAFPLIAALALRVRDMAFATLLAVFGVLLGVYAIVVPISLLTP